MNHKGPDPAFPYLEETQRFIFPLPEESSHSSIVAMGGNLSPGMLLSAYEQGIFPWYNEGEPIYWHSPDPRLLVFPHTLHISKTMKKIIKNNCFRITYNKNFDEVIKACAKTFRPRQGGTWITGDMIKAYNDLHSLGWAISAEARVEGQKTLAGGCYGIQIGNVFFGESMFSVAPNASKAAFLSLAQQLFKNGAAFIDCQLPTPHLESLGGIHVSRKEYLKLLSETLASREQP